MNLPKINSGVGNMKKEIIVFIVLSLITGITSAQNFNDALRLSENGISLNAKALGMGNAFISRLSGVSSSQFNPAAIAFAKKAQFDASLDFNSMSNDATLFGNKVNGSQSSTNFNEVGVILPVPTIQGSLALALGYNQNKNFNKILSFSGFNSGNNSMIQDLVSGNDDLAYDLALSYPIYDANNKYLNDVTEINGNLNQASKITSDGGINNWYLSGAVEIEKDIFVGATLNLLSGSFNRTRIYTEEDTQNYYKSTLLLDPLEPKSADFQSFTTTDVIKWDIAGWDFKLGLIAKINEQVNVGFTVRVPRTYTIKETYSVSGKSKFGTGTIWNAQYDDSKIEYDVTAPAEYSAGASYAERNFTLSGEIKLVDYSSMEFSSGFDGLTRDEKNRDIKDLMRSTININAGGEYLIPNLGLAVRAGFMMMPSAFKDDPSEYDKKFITAGLGYNLTKGTQLNIGYAYGWWEDFGDNYGSGLSRTFQKVSVSNFTTSLKFNF